MDKSIKYLRMFACVQAIINNMIDLHFKNRKQYFEFVKLYKFKHKTFNINPQIIMDNMNLNLYTSYSSTYIDINLMM